jgi:hypothetical protein
MVAAELRAGTTMILDKYGMQCFLVLEAKEKEFTLFG